jgi:hypothetical protein
MGLVPLRRRTEQVASMAALLVLVAACSGGGPAQSNGAAKAGATTSVAQPATTAVRRPVREYPGGGPPDPVFPPGDRAYELLASGQCSTLLTKVQAWDNRVVAQEGEDTVLVYRAAASACLLHWGDADRDMGALQQHNPDFGGSCPRQQVYRWVTALVAAHRQDPSFNPVFVAAAQRSPCTSDAHSPPSSEPTSSSRPSATTSVTTTTTSR